MNNTKKRGILATAGALVTAAALALGGAAAANAAPVDNMPDTSAVVITKYDSTPGDAATGLSQTVEGTPVPGATFEAYAVPVKSGDADLVPGTNEWQEAAAKITPADAVELLDAKPTAVRTGTTGTNGVIVWADAAVDGVAPAAGSLDRGLYLVRETGVPTGFAPSSDFLLAVPLTHPTALNSWLDTIYVYPKNRVVEGTKTVVNDEDYVVGDTVTWTIKIDNPSARDSATGDYIAADKFLILDTIEDKFLTQTEVRVAAPTGLIDTEDYVVTSVPGSETNGIAAGFTQIQVNFTAAGLAKLAGVMNETPAEGNVVVEIDTTVNQLGIIENSAQFYSSESQSDPTEIDPATVKYGSYKLRKDSSNEAVTDLSGAEFRVYLTKEAADAAGDDYVITKENPEGLWTTDADGNVSVGGLRYSDFANGKTLVEGTDDEFQIYWLAEVKALDEHQLLAAPVSFLVNADSAEQTAQVIVNQENTNGFVLPLTGGMGTLLLTILGVGILAVVLFVARRRKSIAPTE